MLILFLYGKNRTGTEAPALVIAIGMVYQPSVAVGAAAAA